MTTPLNPFAGSRRDIRKGTVKFFITAALLCACFLCFGISCTGKKESAPPPPFPSASPQTTEAGITQQVQDLIKSGKYDEAVKKIDSGVLKKLTVGDFEDITDMFRNAGRKNEALQVVEAARKEFPDNREILRLYSNLLFDCGRGEQAEEAIIDDMEKEGKSPGYYYMLLGELSILKRDKPEAAETLKRSIEFLGIESRRINVPEGTLQAYAEACTLYGSVMLKQKKYKKAGKILDKALHICDQIKQETGAEAAGDRYSAVYFQKARLNMIQNKLPEALECVENVGKYAPGSMDYYVIRSEYYRAAGDFKNAEKVLLEMIREKPLMEDEASIRLSSVYCGMKDKLQALKYFRLAMEKTGNKAKIINLMGENPFFDFIKDEPEVKKAMTEVSHK